MGTGNQQPLNFLSSQQQNRSRLHERRRRRRTWKRAEQYVCLVPIELILLWKIGLHSAPVECFHAGQKGPYPFARVVRKSQTAKLFGRKFPKPAEKVFRAGIIFPTLSVSPLVSYWNCWMKYKTAGGNYTNLHVRQLFIWHFSIWTFKKELQTKNRKRTKIQLMGKKWTSQNKIVYTHWARVTNSRRVPSSCKAGCFQCDRLCSLFTLRHVPDVYDAIIIIT
jgi:hypothetical protein